MKLNKLTKQQLVTLATLLFRQLDFEIHRHDLLRIQLERLLKADTAAAKFNG